MDEPAVGNVALVVTELATNLVKHAQGGELLMRRLGPDGQEGIEVLSLDKGPGMANVGRSLDGRLFDSGQSGNGTRRRPPNGRGNSTSTRSPARELPWWQEWAVDRAGQGRRMRRLSEWSVKPRREKRCAATIGWSVGSPDGWVCAVADGLGHGVIASEAAGAIIEAVRSAPANRTPVDLVEAAHQAAKPTRGAALGVAVMDGAQGLLRFSGIGNIAALVINGTERRHLVSHNGIIGHEYRKLSEFSHPWHAQSVLLLHSDGIATQWDLDRYPGLLSRDPSLIAGILYRDFTRGRDDATVVVVKARASADLPSSE